MIFAWISKRRRRRRLAEPEPAGWRDILADRVPPWHCLADDERDRLLDGTRILVAEKHWEGCGGLVVTEEMKVTIAGWAALLVLNLDHDYYRGTRTILVYPQAYCVEREESIGGGGTVVDTEFGAAGEAHLRGPVVLSWSDVTWGGRGRNVVLHEFAHKLDMHDDFVDGTPPLATRAERAAWTRIMQRHFEHLRRGVQAGRRTLIDDYGATDEGEFFACVTESFFEQGRDLVREHPDLYEVMKNFYHQDPAGWKRR